MEKGKIGVPELRNPGTNIDIKFVTGDIAPHAKNQSDRPLGASRQMCEILLSCVYFLFESVVALLLMLRCY